MSREQEELGCGDAPHASRTPPPKRRAAVMPMIAEVRNLAEPACGAAQTEIDVFQIRSKACPVAHALE